MIKSNARNYDSKVVFIATTMNKIKCSLTLKIQHMLTKHNPFHIWCTGFWDRWQSWDNPQRAHLDHQYTKSCIFSSTRHEPFSRDGITPETKQFFSLAAIKHANVDSFRGSKFNFCDHRFKKKNWGYVRNVWCDYFLRNEQMCATNITWVYAW